MPFVREFNAERPHEALDVKCPAELYDLGYFDLEQKTLQPRGVGRALAAAFGKNLFLNIRCPQVRQCPLQPNKRPPLSSMNRQGLPRDNQGAVSP